MTDLSLDQRYRALRDAKLPPAKRILAAFGRNVDGYDLGGDDGTGPDEDANFETGDFGDGSPGRDLVGDCLRVWASGWQRFDVATAAAVFTMTEDLVREVAPPPFVYAGRDPTVDMDFGSAVQLLAGQRSYFALDVEGVAPEPMPDTQDYLDSYLEPTVAEVAALLNVEESAVLRVVEEHPYLYAGPERDGSPTIGADGD